MRSIIAFGVVVLLSSTLLVRPVAADGETYAVVDRMDDVYAVLLIEEDGETTDQRVVDPAVLDEEGRYEGAVHQVVDDGYVYDEAETERRERANSGRIGGLTEGF